MIVKYRRLFSIYFFLSDVVALFLSYGLAYAIKFYPQMPFAMEDIYYRSLFWILPTILVIYYFFGLYQGDFARRFRKEMLAVSKGHLVAMVTVFSFLYLTKSYLYSRVMIFSFGWISLALVLVLRGMLIKGVWLGKWNKRNILVLGAGILGLKFVAKANAYQEFGYRIIGYLDDDPKKLHKTYAGSKVLGRVDQLSEFLVEQKVEEVVVALPLRAHEKFNEIVEACEEVGIRVRIIPDYFDYLPGRPKVEELDEIPLLNVRHVPLDDPLNRFIKRLFDMVFSALIIFLLSPILISIAVLVKFTSPGPILFKQERVGLDNKSFHMFKFRSMRVVSDNSGDTHWTTAEDPRKTKLGTFLRKTSLDELPQFFNVLLGNMSVVGPRPERPFFVEKFRKEIPKYMVKHQVKPGITGWAQVNGWRGDTSIKKRIEFDIYYIENWDFLFDVKIVWLTVWKGLLNKNAY